MKPVRMFLLLLLVLSAATLASADVVFHDTTFNLPDYNLYYYISDPSSMVMGFPVRLCDSCGLSGGALMSLGVSYNTISPPPPARSDWVALINNTFAYDPQTQGAITSLAASGWKNISTSIPVTSGDAFAIRILQDGKMYGYAIPWVGEWTGTSSGWNWFSQSGLTSDLFRQYNLVTGLVDPNSHPDFAGSEMLFGIGKWTSWTSTSSLDVVNTWQDVTFQVHTVPEPGSLLLLGSGLLGLGGALRRTLGA